MTADAAMTPKDLKRLQEEACQDREALDPERPAVAARLTITSKR